MRALAYLCAFLGMALAIAGLADHLFLTQVQILPHLAFILIGMGAGIVFCGFLLFARLAMRQRHVMDEAAMALPRGSAPGRHWVLD